jgi:uncharacterized protein YegP (UPF0339 family)
MASTFELKKSTDGQFMFNLKAGNGEIILTSERYQAKSSAQQGIASVKANAPIDGRYNRKTAKNGEPYFTLVATNGEIIGNSEQYSSLAALEGGIASVKHNAPLASVNDLTS